MVDDEVAQHVRQGLHHLLGRVHGDSLGSSVAG